MAGYPASTKKLSSALEAVDGAANRLKLRAQNMVTASAAGPTRREEYIQFMQQITQAVEVWDQAMALPGFSDYVQAQKGGEQLDAVAELTALRTAALTVRSWIHTNFPKDSGNNAIHECTIDATGARTQLTFSTAATAQFRTNVNALIALVV